MKNLMKAAVFHGKHDLRIEQIEMPKIKENEVLVKVAYCGVCGTDVHIFEGDKGCAEVHPPIVLGHEFSGIVAEVGAAVQGRKAGDRVNVDPNVLCESCKYCLSAKGHFCEHMTGIGTMVNGGFAEYVAVPAKQTHLISEKTDMQSAAIIAASSAAALNNQIDHAALQKHITGEIHGISNGNLNRTRNLESELGVRSYNMGISNRNAGITMQPTGKAERSIKVFQKKDTETAAEKFLKKQEKITGKKINKLENKQKNRQEKLSNKAALRKAKLDFMITTLLDDESKSGKVAGLELMKQIFFVHGKTLGKKLMKKGTLFLKFVIGGIVHLFLSVFMTFFSLLMTFLLPVLLVGVCVLTIYSAIAYIGGFFGFGDGNGVVQVDAKEVNITEQANGLYSSLEEEIKAYVGKSRVQKNTETEYVEDSYKITYPYGTSPAKGDFLANYFTKMADVKVEEISEEELLPYMNINTYTEKTTLQTVFNQMHYFGEETYSETKRQELIGYEQRKVVKTVLIGYRDVSTEYSVSQNDWIYNNGQKASGSTGIYIKANKKDYKNYMQLTKEQLKSNNMYCYLHTTNSNKIPLGTEITVQLNYRIAGITRTGTIKAQIIGIDSSGTDLYRNQPYLELFVNTRSNMSLEERTDATLISFHLQNQKNPVRFTALRSRTAYLYTLTHKEPVYELQESWEDDPDKPIYKTYTYRTYSKPVYYLTAGKWYAKYSNTLSQNQKEVWKACKELYAAVSY